LEQIFSKLTGKEDGNIDASHIISAIR